MKITLSEWGAQNYDPAPSMHILRSWAKSGQISPAPEKVGKVWMVDENAIRKPAETLAESGDDAQNTPDASTLSPRALHILKAA